MNSSNPLQDGVLPAAHLLAPFEEHIEKHASEPYKYSSNRSAKIIWYTRMACSFSTSFENIREKCIIAKQQGRKERLVFVS